MYQTDTSQEKTLLTLAVKEKLKRKEKTLMASSIYRYQTILERATSAGTPNRDKSLDAWQRRAIVTREVMLTIKEDYKKKLDELKDRYSAKAFEIERQPVDDDYNKIREIAIQKVLEDLGNVLDGKRAQFDKSSGAPTAEDLRLLDALNMRSSLTLAEIAAVSGKFNGNVQAIRVLGDIARKHGISFPDIGDPEHFEALMERAEQFSKEHIEEIDVERDRLGYKGMLFWEHPGEGEAPSFFGMLDNQGFTAEQLTEATRENQQKEDAETDSPLTATMTGEGAPVEMWAEVKLKGTEYISSVADQFHVSTKQIREANPGRDLDHLYSGDKIYVPATKFSFLPGQGHIQPDQVRAVPRPVYEEPKGPNGEAVLEDVSIV